MIDSTTFEGQNEVLFPLIKGSYVYKLKPKYRLCFLNSCNYPRCSCPNVVSVVCGAAAIVLALLANNKKENLSQIALVVAIAGAAIGSILGLLLGDRIFLI